MMEAILALDRELFLLVNLFPHTSLFEAFAKLLSGVGTWGVVWLVIALLLFFREEKRDHWFFLPSALVLLGGFLSEFFVKTLIARPRPTPADTFSFPSSHAILAFAFAYILSREEPKLKRWFYLLAILISLSRVFLGVHYPSDIIAGMFLGIMIGWLSLTLESFGPQKLIRKLPKQSKKIQ